MGMSHALAYTRIPGFEVVGVCERRIADRKLPPELAKAKKFDNFERALAELEPDVVSINTLPDTHADFAIKAMEAGADVFVEKPLADSVANAERVIATAQRTKRKLVVGYILRQHPSWTKFIQIARQLSSPSSSGRIDSAVERRDLGLAQAAHGQLSADRRLRGALCRRDVSITKAKPHKVHAIGARLTDEVPVNNYGMLQVVFEDGSVGWYEAGWGPMMSETAFFVKDVVGPKGSVSIVMAETAGAVKSDDINARTKTNQIVWHHTDMSKPDERIDVRTSLTTTRSASVSSAI